jgi:hypothetical protein
MEAAGLCGIFVSLHQITRHDTPEAVIRLILCYEVLVPFAKHFLKATSTRVMPVLPHDIPLDGFSPIFVFEYFAKLCLHFQSSVKICLK